MIWASVMEWSSLLNNCVENLGHHCGWKTVIIIWFSVFGCCVFMLNQSTKASIYCTSSKASESVLFVSGITVIQQCSVYTFSPLRSQQSPYRVVDSSRLFNYSQKQPFTIYMTVTVHSRMSAITMWFKKYLSSNTIWVKSFLSSTFGEGSSIHK